MNRIGILSLAFSSCVRIIVSPTVGTDSDDRSPGSLQIVGTMPGKPFSQEVWGFICQWLTMITKLTWKHNAAFFGPRAYAGGPSQIFHPNQRVISPALLRDKCSISLLDGTAPSFSYSPLFLGPDLGTPPEFGWEISYFLGPVFSAFCVVGYLASSPLEM